MVGEEINKQSITNFMVGMREAGISPSSCNVYSKGMNGYLVWLYENGYISERLRIKQLKCEQKVIKP
jgi:hypothetical protein